MIGPPFDVAQAPKKAGLLKKLGDMGIAVCGKTNFVSMLGLFDICGCSAVGGVVLPLLKESLFWEIELCDVCCIWEVAGKAVGVITAGYCHTEGDRTPLYEKMGEGEEEKKHQ